MAKLAAPAAEPRKRYMVKAVQDIVNTRFARHAKRLPRPSRTAVTNRASTVGDIQSRTDGRIKCLSRDGAPERIEVVGTEKRTYWHGMKLDSMRIKVHEAVCVKMSDGKQEQGLVTSLFEVESAGGQKDFKAHVHWLTSGRTAQPGELFLRHCQCDTIPLRAIHAKMDDFQYRGEMADAIHPAKRFARLVWHESESVWREPVSSATCDSCHHRRILAANRPDAVTWRAGHFTLRGDIFHVGDHVLVDSQETGIPWRVGVILGWDDVHGGRVRLQVLLRYCDVKHGLGPGDYHDGRELFLSDRHIDVASRLVVRKTFLSESGDSTEFFCRRDDRLRPLKRALRSCAPCLAADTKRRINLSQLLAKDKLPAVDLYSGGGGTIQGAKPFLKITHAVEIDPTACKTLTFNHPGTEVLPERMAVLHHRALRHERDGFQIQGCVLPPEGSVFMLSAGPPCQGHSGANRHKDGEDLRNEEVAHTVSELSRTQADVFLLENVRGFTQDRSDGVFTDDSESSSFADMAVKMLIAIGYQCRVALLDSRAYGSPQRRVRCFVLAARTGVPLPRFPEPTHASPRPAGMRVVIGEDGKKKVTVYSCLQEVTPGTGPCAAVTAQEAISDLPAFDFAPAGQASTRGSSRRPRFPSRVGPEGKATRVGFDQPTRYLSPPRNSFQQRIRGSAQRVLDHHTGYLTPKQLDLVFSASTYVGDKDSSTPGSERMLRPDSGFYTLLTNPMPGGRTTGTIHWSQKRTFTIAERRRAMGFPDDYVFAGTPPQVDHQLGNAMVVNLMESIYRQIMVDTVLLWWIASGKPDDLMSAWRRDHPIK